MSPDNPILTRSINLNLPNWRFLHQSSLSLSPGSGFVQQSARRKEKRVKSFLNAVAYNMPITKSHYTIEVIAQPWTTAAVNALRSCWAAKVEEARPQGQHENAGTHGTYPWMAYICRLGCICKVHMHTVSHGPPNCLPKNDLTTKARLDDWNQYMQWHTLMWIICLW